jgi:acetyl esterase/lipase
MTIHDRIDPESHEGLKVLLDAMPGGLNGIAEIGARRQKLQDVISAMTAHIEPNPNVATEDRTVARPEGAPDVPVRIYRNVNAEGPTPGVFYIHGGGMIMGDLSMGELSVIRMCEVTGATFVSVDYRLAPEHPYPAAVEDCFAALSWMDANRGDIGVRPGALSIVGASAGGGLTIATSLVARDRGGPEVGFQMPFYPMIDDRNETPSSHEITDIGIWDRAGNIEAWGWYLGARKADGYAAPARATDLSNLPPTYMDVGTLDLFRDENIAFSQRLVQAGVPVEFHLWPGAFHASETFAPGAALSQRIWATRLAALTKAVNQ